MRNTPLVSVICLSYNHAEYVIESLESVINQSYKNIELLIADDCSTDNSVEVISKWLENFPETIFIKNEKNLGNTKTFNSLLKLAKGEYIIDLAADDVLLKNCIETQLKAFQIAKVKNIAIVYGNIELINEKSDFIKHYYDVNSEKKVLKMPPSGDIYESIIGQKEKICSVSSMVKKEIFDIVGNYDESLAYEDLDFWIRTARNHSFEYIDEILAQKRELSNSLSAQFFIKKNKKINYSTYKILQKIYILNISKSEFNTMLKRVHGEMENAFKKQNWKLLLKLSFLKLKIMIKIWF
jgi:glycosyltransferase involved in cell wall biosynthesis